MKNMKQLIALVLALVMCLSLAACGGSGDAKPEGGNAAGSMEEIKVCVWDNNQKPGLQEIADKWSETSGIKVTIEVVDWNNYWTLLEAGASGGEMPDVFWMHSNTVQMYMENDLLLKLDDYVAADESTDMKNYYEGITELYTRKDNGGLYAIPKDHDTIALLYNKAIFDQYGVAYPTDDWTWEDMYEASKAITEASNGEVYGLALNTSNNQDGYYNVVYSYGAQIITDDHKGTTIGSAEGKQAMEMVRKLLTTAIPQAVVAESGTDSLFVSGKVAMITQGSWMIRYFYDAENHADYAWAMLPYADVNGNGTCEKEERWSCYNGLGWAAKADVADPQAAYDLIAYFCSKEGQLLQSEKGITLAGMIGCSDAFATAFDGMDVSAFIKVEEQGSLFFNPYTRNTIVWDNALQKAGGFLDAWQNPNDPALMAAACDNAQRIIEEAIAAE